MSRETKRAADASSAAMQSEHVDDQAERHREDIIRMAVDRIRGQAPGAPPPLVSDSASPPEVGGEQPSVQEAATATKRRAARRGDGARAAAAASPRPRKHARRQVQGRDAGGSPPRNHDLEAAFQLRPQNVGVIPAVPIGQCNAASGSPLPPNSSAPLSQEAGSYENAALREQVKSLHLALELSRQREQSSFAMLKTLRHQLHEAYRMIAPNVCNSDGTLWGHHEGVASPCAGRQPGHWACEAASQPGFSAREAYLQGGRPFAPPGSWMVPSAAAMAPSKLSPAAHSTPATVSGSSSFDGPDLFDEDGAEESLP